MHSHFTRTWRTKIAAGASAAVLSAFALIASVQAADPNTAVDAIKTATPIKHVIIIVGENRSFDHIFATYVPKRREEGIRNLLSEHIVNADGTPGRKFAILALRGYLVVAVALLIVKAAQLAVGR